MPTRSQSTLALAAAFAAVAGCTALPVPPGTAGLPRLYIEGYQPITRGETHGRGDPDDVTKIMEAMADWTDLGVYLTRDYIVSIDPLLVIKTLSHKTVPADATTPETAVVPTQADGNSLVLARPVLKTPLYYLENAVVSYKFANYTKDQIPDQTFQLNYAMKETETRINSIRVNSVQPIIRNLMANPFETPSEVGTATITVNCIDLDPMLWGDANAQVRKFSVSRTFNVRYSYGSGLFAEITKGTTPIQIPQPTIFGTPAPADAQNATGAR